MDIRKIVTMTGIMLLVMMLFSGSTAFAQSPNENGVNADNATAANTGEATEDNAQWVLIGDLGLKAVGIGLGLGLVIIGGGKGIGNIGSSAVEAVARQPEAANDIRGLGVLLAAFVEGGMLFGVVVLLLGLFLI